MGKEISHRRKKLTAVERAVTERIAVERTAAEEIPAEVPPIEAAGPATNEAETPNDKGVVVELVTTKASAVKSRKRKKKSAKR